MAVFVGGRVGILCNKSPTVLGSYLGSFKTGALLFWGANWDP